MTVIALSICFMIGLSGALASKSKAIYIVQCLWIWLLIAFTFDGVDYHINEMIYLNGGIPTEWLSTHVIRFFLNHNIDYMWYRTFWYTISISILCWIVWKYSDRPGIAIVLFSISTLADSSAQCRYFWAMSLVLLAIHFFYINRKVLTIGLIFLSTGVHGGMLLYVVAFVVYWFIKRRNANAKISLVIIGELLLIPLLPHILNAIGLPYIAEKYEYYMFHDQYSSAFVGVLFCVLYGSLVFCTYIVAKQTKIKAPMDSFVMLLMVDGMIFLPFLFYNSVFARFYRIPLIISYIYLSGRMIHLKKINKYNIPIVVFLILTVSSSWYFQDVAGWFVFENLFECNYWINMLLG